VQVIIIIIIIIIIIMNSGDNCRHPNHPPFFTFKGEIHQKQETIFLGSHSKLNKLIALAIKAA